MESAQFEFKKPSLGQAINGSMMMAMIFFIIGGVIIKLLMGVIDDPYLMGGSFALGAGLGFQWSFWKYYRSTIGQLEIGPQGLKFNQQIVPLEDIESLWEDKPRALHIRVGAHVYHAHLKDPSPEAFEQLTDTLRRFGRARQLQTLGTIMAPAGVIGYKVAASTSLETSATPPNRQTQEILKVLFAWLFSLPILLFTVLMLTVWTSVPLTNFSEVLMGRAVLTLGVAVAFTWIFQILRRRKIIPGSKLVPLLLGVLWFQTTMISTYSYLNHQYISSHRTEFEAQAKSSSRTIATSEAQHKYVISNGKLHEIKIKHSDGSRSVATPDNGGSRNRLLYRDQNQSGGSYNLGNPND